GKGMAGRWKHKKVHFNLYEQEYINKNRGFKRPAEIVHDPTTITLRDLEDRLPELLASGKAAKEGDATVVNLTALGVEKLLGTGRATRKLRITVDAATPGAAEKVQAAGGAIEAPAGGD
ncbi:MAG: uL15m family ribosomal protein, partial [Methanobacteriota archaeon]